MPPHDATVVAARRADCSFYNPHIVSRSPAGCSKAGVVQNLDNSAARAVPCGKWRKASLAAIFTPGGFRKMLPHRSARLDQLSHGATTPPLCPSEFQTSCRRPNFGHRTDSLRQIVVGKSLPRTRFRVCIGAPGGSDDLCRSGLCYCWNGSKQFPTLQDF